MKKKRKKNKAKDRQAKDEGRTKQKCYVNVLRTSCRSRRSITEEIAEGTRERERLREEEEEGERHHNMVEWFH